MILRVDAQRQVFVIIFRNSRGLFVIPQLTFQVPTDRQGPKGFKDPELRAVAQIGKAVGYIAAARGAFLPADLRTKLGAVISSEFTEMINKRD